MKINLVVLNILYYICLSKRYNMNQEKKKVGAKKKYKIQPRQMNVRFVKDTDHKKIKTLEKKLLKLNEIK